MSYHAFSGHGGGGGGHGGGGHGGGGHGGGGHTHVVVHTGRGGSGGWGYGGGYWPYYWDGTTWILSPDKGCEGLLPNNIPGYKGCIEHTYGISLSGALGMERQSQAGQHAPVPAGRHPVPQGQRPKYHPSDSINLNAYYDGAETTIRLSPDQKMSGGRMHALCAQLLGDSKLVAELSKIGLRSAHAMMQISCNFGRFLSGTGLPGKPDPRRLAELARAFVKGRYLVVTVRLHTDSLFNGYQETPIYSVQGPVPH